MKSYPTLCTIITSLIVLGLISVNPLIIYAQPGTASSSTTAQIKPGANNAARISAIKLKAEAEIDKRLASLNTAATKINAAIKLSASDKSTFSSEIKTDITNLSALRAKIDADTDLTTLRADAKSIYADFRVYAVFLPQVHQLATVDIMGVTADNLTNLATKLQSRIQAAQQKGKNVSSLQTLLADLNTKVVDAKTESQAIESEIAPLTPASYPGSTAILKDGRNKIKTATADLKAAWQDAKQIAQGLKALNSIKNSGASLSASPAAAK